ncbi:ABC transporter substrate-binding protein [Methylobacterium sp.]|uniref:ABC transporter substrate-binding protein n=1 Tax=Methylobacterium sp. TaxID=409 RepID=UPI00262C064E|nr:ABC transporter substrate-binding protein [Methylobacterium sp.]
MSATALAGCLGFGIAGPAQAANVFRFAFQGDIKSLDPYSLKESFTIGMHGAIFDSLITRDKDLNIVPMLAESWETPEPTRWRFHLRKGVKFHDGSDFTADDVIFSATRVRAPGSNFTTNVPSDATWVKVDDHTVDMVLKSPNPIALYQFSTWYIMSKSWAEKTGAVAPTLPSATSTSYAALHENGTGPFIVSEHQPGVRTVFKKNPNYWGKVESNLDEAVFTTIQNDATRVAALISGEVDWIEPVPLQDAQRVNASGTAAVMAGPELRTIFLGMDQSRDELKDSNVKGKNPFKDVRVREAFYRAIDEETIAKRVMRGQAVPSALLIAPVLFPRAAEFKRPDYDPKRAKALLTEAGYPDGFSLGMDCPNDRYVNDEAICQAVVSMLARIDVKLDLQAQTRNKFFAKIMRKGDYSPAKVNLYLMAWSPASTYDVHNVFDSLLQTPSPVTKRGQANIGGYSNPALDALADKIDQEADPKARQDMVRAATKIYVDDYAYVPLHQQAIVWAVRKNVDVFQPADNTFPLRWVSVH